MNHQGTKTLQTERLLLRRFRIEDAEEFYRNVTSDSKVNKFLTWSLHKSVEETRELLIDWGERYENSERYCWALVTEALIEVIRYLFEEVQVNRIEAGYDVNNPASGRVLEKVGMQKEGVLRRAGRNNQGLFDLVFCAILRSDFA